MRIFITGATGFIGTHLCHQLVAEGHNIVALVRNQQKAKALPKKNIEILKGDLALLQKPNLKLPACDLVIHLAGLVAARRVSDYFICNYQATRDLVACVARQNWRPKRFLFASSLAAAGPSEINQPRSEGDMEEPVDPYGKSKLEAERFIHHHVDYPVTIFRPGAVIGPGDAAFLSVFKMAERGIGIKVAGINQKFSYVYVEDLVDAVVRLCGDPTPENRLYFTAYPEEASINQMWDQLRVVMGRKILVVPIPKPVLYTLMLSASVMAKIIPFHNQLDEKQYQHLTVPAFTCSSRAIQKDFGWQPQYDLAASLKKTAEGYRAVGWL